MSQALTAHIPSTGTVKLSTWPTMDREFSRLYEQLQASLEAEECTGDGTDGIDSDGPAALAGETADD